MIAKMGGTQRRWLAIGLAVFVVVLAMGAIVFPTWWLHQRYNRALDEFSDQLARHQRIAATREATDVRLAALRAKQVHRNFLKSATPSVAASELQDIVRASMDAAGVRFISMQVPPHKDEGRYRQVTVNVQMSATGPALRRMLHSLETGQPLALVENLTIRQSVGPGFRPAPGTEPEMFVQADVVAYTIGGAP